MISALVNGCGLRPTASAAIAISSTAMTMPVMTSRTMRLASFALACSRISARFARSEQRDARDQEDERGDVEPGHRSRVPSRAADRAATDGRRRSARR